MVLLKLEVKSPSNSILEANGSDKGYPGKLVSALMMALTLFLVSFGPFDERRKQINWDRQNGRGVMLARNFLHRL